MVGGGGRGGGAIIFVFLTGFYGLFDDAVNTGGWGWVRLLVALVGGAVLADGGGAGGGRSGIGPAGAQTLGVVGGRLGPLGQLLPHL